METISKIFFCGSAIFFGVMAYYSYKTDKEVKKWSEMTVKNQEQMRKFCNKVNFTEE